METENYRRPPSKVRANEIRSARFLSRAPLLLSVSYVGGGSDTFNVSQLDSEMTGPARQRALYMARGWNIVSKAGALRCAVEDVGAGQCYGGYGGWQYAYWDKQSGEWSTSSHNSYQAAVAARAEHIAQIAARMITNADWIDIQCVELRAGSVAQKLNQLLDELAGS